MFEDYTKRVNEAFGKYEWEMIKLGFALDEVASRLEDVAEHCLTVSEECEEVSDNIAKYIKKWKAQLWTEGMTDGN